MKKSGNSHSSSSIQTSLLFFADTPNNAIVLRRHSKQNIIESRSLPTSQISGRFTIPLFQLSVWCEKCVAARHYADVGIQLLFANNRNRVRCVVFCLSEDGACTDLFENFSENSLKQGLSIDTTFDPPLFSLVNTFKDTVKAVYESINSNIKGIDQWEKRWVESGIIR